MTKKEQLRYLAMLPKVIEALGELADEADGIKALMARVGMREQVAKPTEFFVPPLAHVADPEDEPHRFPETQARKIRRTLPAAQRRAIAEGFVPDPGLRATKLQQFTHDDVEDEDTTTPPPLRESINTISGGDYDPDVDGDS